METALKCPLQPSSTTHDPSQPHLSFVPPPARPQAPQVNEPLPTATNSPHLTPIQRRIKKRRAKQQRTIIEPTGVYLETHDTGTPAPPMQERPAPLPILTRRRRQTHRLHRDVRPSRTPHPHQGRQTHQHTLGLNHGPEPDAQITLQHRVTTAEQRRRLLEGSWRPPQIKKKYSLHFESEARPEPDLHVVEY